MEANFIPIDYDYFDYNGQNYAKIIGRTDKGEKACIIDKCNTYFWAILKDKVSEKRIKEIQEKIDSIKVKSKSRISRVLKTEIHAKNFLGKPVKAIKIFVTNLKDAHDIAGKIGMKEIYKRREYDLNFTTKYILGKKLKPLHWYNIKGELLNNSPEFNGIDSGLNVDICLQVEKFKEIKKKDFEPKILAYDIETDEFEIGKGNILMISLVGNNFKKVLTWKKESKKDFVENYKDEADMLEAFIKEVKNYNPDILVGYFSDGFDLPYLRARANKNKIKLSLGTDNSQPVFSRGALMTGKIKGIIHIDLLRFIKNAYSQYLQSETLSLNEVAGELLGERKTDFNVFENLKKAKINWEKFYEYNLQDSVLTFKLAEKLWPGLFEFTKIVCEPLFDVSRNTMASNFEDFTIHSLEKFNEIAEKRPTHEEIGKRRMHRRYEGAFVFQPTPGLYEKVIFFDFSSMYGSIIVTYNLSRSTMTDDKKNSYVGDYNRKKVYFNKKIGFVPTLLKEIIDLRRIAKKEYNKNPTPILKARSDAYKLIANAAYGYQGFFGARYYSIEAASSTAYFARKHIKQAINNFKKAGFNVIYSDTDSIAIELKNKSKTQALETLKKINSKLPGIMELDLEGFYKRGIWVTKRSGDFGAKKKYALIDDEGKLKIRGFETVRRDWCKLARETQNKVLQAILEDGNKERALKIIKDVIKKVKNREVEKKDILIRTQLKKPLEEYKAITPHVVAAQKLKDSGKSIELGMLIEYFIAETKSKKKLVREKVKLPDEKGEYNIKYYLERQILPAIENIIEVFNINSKEMIDGKKQSKLFDF